jgi:homoserine dehydrogenase
VMFYGQGAGGGSAASAVVSDIIFVARNIRAGIGGKVPSIFFETTKTKRKIIPIEDLKFRYFLRFIVNDKPGVLARLATILGESGIGISAVSQKEQGGATTPVIITTDEAKEMNIKKAIEEIDKLPVVKEKTLMLRMEKGE